MTQDDGTGQGGNGPEDQMEPDALSDELRRYYDALGEGAVPPRLQLLAEALGRALTYRQELAEAALAAAPNDDEEPDGTRTGVPPEPLRDIRDESHAILREARLPGDFVAVRPYRLH